MEKKESQGFVELEWVCPNCGGRNKGSKKTCESCGAPQPDNVKFQRAANEKIITDEKVAAVAKAGADIHCGFCGTRNPGNAVTCSQCGGDLKEGKARAAGQVLQAAPAMPKVVTCANCGAENPGSERICAKCGSPLARAAAPKPVQVQAQAISNPTNAQPKKTNWLLFGGIGAVVLLCCAAIMFMFVFPSKSVKGTVSGVEWQTFVPVQEMQSVNYSHESGSAPSDAYNVSCQTENKEICEDKTIDKGKGLIGMLPILLGAIFGYIVAYFFGLVHFETVIASPWVAVPHFTFPAFNNPDAWGMALSIALIFIATVPESTAHLYQMSLYIDELAGEMGRKPYNIKELIGLNLVADGSDDLIVGFLGGSAGTNYGENNSLMAITRNYSTAVLMAAGGMAIVFGFFAKLVALVNTMPAAVVGGLSIYLFGVIGMQGVALIQSEKVNLFDPKQLAVGAVISICGIGGNLALPNGMFPFQVPYLFPNGIPAIVFAAIIGIFINTIFLIFKTPAVRGD